MDQVETRKYRITGLVDYTDEQGNIVGQFEVGSVQELPTFVGDKSVELGQAEVYEGDEDEEEVADDSDTTDTTTTDDTTDTTDAPGADDDNADLDEEESEDEDESGEDDDESDEDDTTA